MPWWMEHWRRMVVICPSVRLNLRLCYRLKPGSHLFCLRCVANLRPEFLRSYARPNNFICTSGRNAMQAKRCEPGFMVWSCVLTSTADASNPESNEKQIPHSKLLINMTVQFLQQIRQWLESEIQRMTLPKQLHSPSFVYLSIPQTSCNWKHSLIWHTPMPDCIYIAISCYCSLCTQTAAWLHCC